MGLGSDQGKKMSKELIEIEPGVQVDPTLYPHIDLTQLSSRPGVDGSRFVRIPGVSVDRQLGDTDTGCVAYSTLPRTLAPKINGVGGVVDRIRSALAVHAQATEM